MLNVDAFVSRTSLSYTDVLMRVLRLILTCKAPCGTTSRSFPWCTMGPLASYADALSLPFSVSGWRAKTHPPCILTWRIKSMLFCFNFAQNLWLYNNRRQNSNSGLVKKDKATWLGWGLVGLVSDTTVSLPTCVWPSSQPRCSPPSALSVFGKSVGLSLVQVVWYWLHYRYIKAPCVFAWHQRVSFASGRDAKGRDKTSTSDNLGMPGVRRYVGDLTWSHSCLPHFKWRYPSATPLLCLQHHQYAAMTFSV